MHTHVSKKVDMWFLLQKGMTLPNSITVGKKMHTHVPNKVDMWFILQKEMTLIAFQLIVLAKIGYDLMFSILLLNTMFVIFKID